MAPSQLKRLKASLREKGIIAQQQSKKQKKQNAKSGATAASKAHRHNVLQELREQFNPFEARAPARPSKFAVTTSRGTSETVRHRPGVTRGLGEQRRKDTLLKEIHGRNKIGMLLDRRFGENDPTMTPEERAAERFARESQKRLKKDTMFNLEDDEDDEMLLTHGGQALSFDQAPGDDFKEDFLSASDDGSDAGRRSKRKRVFEEDDMEGLAGASDDDEQPGRKKSKQEVMKELIAKSKLYKYERQKAKEDDDDLRDALDKGLPSIFEMMRSTRAPEPPRQELPPEPAMNPDRAALLDGKDREVADKEYDQRLKQMAFDKRSKPSDRTKTEEEIAEEEANRLRELEKERLKRMQGEDDEESANENGLDLEGDDDAEFDDAKQFGLHQLTTRPDLDVEDEDEFILEDDLIETGSAVDLSFDESDGHESAVEDEDEDEEDDDFINGLTLPLGTAGANSHTAVSNVDNPSLAYTYPCPSTHDEFLKILECVKTEDLPTVVQRIRALHNPKLHHDNKAKLGRFARILVEHTAYLTNHPEHPPFAVLENLLRHIHSLSKSHPEDVAISFRAHLREIRESRALNFLPGDLILLTGISTIFPTSDHFHPVVTPAMLSIARYLGQGNIESLGDIATGTYVASLCLQYQALSKRYIPELINYVSNALCLLTPAPSRNVPLMFPVRQPSTSMLLDIANGVGEVKKPGFWDVLADSSLEKGKAEGLKVSLIQSLATIIDVASDLWAEKSAFFEVFTPVQALLKHVQQYIAGKVPVGLSAHIQQVCDNVALRLKKARRSRRPLLLHNHRPLAIKTAIPKFEESFNPDKHYDPDRERAELSKLKAEHKRERKGAMRELRKDANFIARESLREKRARDAEYEQKYRRLVAEIQSEEGREAKAYERERRKRKGRQ
ncbi:nucleolar complex protein 14 [Ophidiomyces ophidiicola]|uniref:nucleolar complex protein 14 n=1 Tax=Ophidiomyces ophidiicola TaxID=1387563 RepID=UPI0020C354A3|nr:nucleolar complex protein 14 [Ophidiomyces ophidiicola]KAI1917168.1 nucleolar complex protein 14 [Ophidiomyces ophidiicola]KAI1929712.1 nucleolar complex protein 14 [Ophidiomyces ophidiicola]KAI1946486.1 nucleolar complex protein 14 [Ophidiomyces ophidiicola]KAI1960466.1 nucleolar complex protein 14 [Ophidiomyces ophidiicola]KAI1969406.1 nucleolar complex protein 14 [Ophidiomyces ophidiicola]